MWRTRDLDEDVNRNGLGRDEGTTEGREKPKTKRQIYTALVEDLMPKKRSWILRERSWHSPVKASLISSLRSHTTSRGRVRSMILFFLVFFLFRGAVVLFCIPPMPNKANQLLRRLSTTTVLARAGTAGQTA